MHSPNPAPERDSTLLRRHPTLVGSGLVVLVFLLAAPLAILHLRRAAAADAGAPAVPADLAARAGMGAAAGGPATGAKALGAGERALLERFARVVSEGDGGALAALFPDAPPGFLAGLAGVRARLGQGGRLTVAQARRLGGGEVEFVLRGPGEAGAPPVELPFAAQLAQAGGGWRIDTLRRLDAAAAGGQ